MKVGSGQDCFSESKQEDGDITRRHIESSSPGTVFMCASCVLNTAPHSVVAVTSYRCGLHIG